MITIYAEQAEVVFDEEILGALNLQGRCAPLRRSAMRRAPELIGRTDCARARNAGPARLAPELDARAASSRLPNERLRYALFLLLDHYEMAAKWAEEKKTGLTDRPPQLPTKFQAKANPFDLLQSDE